MQFIISGSYPPVRHTENNSPKIYTRKQLLPYTCFFTKIKEIVAFSTRITKQWKEKVCGLENLENSSLNSISFSEDKFSETVNILIFSEVFIFLESIVTHQN